MILNILIASAAVLMWGGVYFLFYRRTRAGRRLSAERSIAAQAAAVVWSEERLTELVRQHPTSPAALRAYTESALNARAWPEALRRAEAYLDAAPRDEHAWVLIVRALRTTKQEAEAEAMLAKALRRLPKSPELLQTRAHIACNRQDWPLAVASLEKLRRSHPDRHEGYTEGVDMLLRAGEAEAARALLAEALRRFPGLPQALACAARLAERLDTPEEALRQWDRAITRCGQTWWLYTGKAAFLGRLGHHDAEVALLQEAKSYFPTAKEIGAALEKAEKALEDKPAT